MPGQSVAGPSESMASAQLGMVTGAGRGLQTSYNSRMQAQPQQQSGFNAVQARVEVHCLLFLHLISFRFI